MQRLVLTDSVENHHGIVDGITDDGQHSRDECLVYIQAERQDSGEDREESHHDDGSMGQAECTAQTPCPFLEPDGDVYEDDEKCDDHGYDGVAFHVIRYGCVHLVRTDDTVRVFRSGCEEVEGHVGCIEVLHGVEEFLFHGCVSLGRLVFDEILCSDLHLAFTTELLGFHTAVEFLHQRCPHFLYRYRLVESDHECTSAGEVHTVCEALGEHGHDADDDDDGGNDISVFSLVEEIDGGILQEVPGEFVVECDVLAFCQSVIDDDTGDEDGCEDRSDDTDDQRGSEALYRTGTEDEQYDTCQYSSDLSVYDGRICVRITVGNRLAQTFAGAEFLLDTFIYDHVRIDRHTQSQDETGDTWQSQYCRERYQGTEQQNHVRQQCRIGDETCAMIEEYHVAEHQQEGYDE